MNFISYIILVTLIVIFLVNIIADLFNLNMASDNLPETFQGYYDKERYKTAQQYLVVNTRFNWIVSLFNSSVFLIFWFIKGFPLMDRFIRSFNTGSVAAGLIFTGSLFFFKSVLSLPFSMYSTFVIEERFGFNKTTGSVYIKDLIKVTVLIIVIGTPLLSVMLLFFEYFGKNAWLLCWAAVTIYMLTIQFLAPTFIMPLFNTFEPLKEGELKTAIFSYASLVKFPLKNVFVMDGSKRSKKSNAFFTGFGKNKRIVLLDTLIQKHTVSELVAILAHEIGHYKKKTSITKYYIWYDGNRLVILFAFFFYVLPGIV